MKRTFAVLTVLGALLALAVPASSMAATMTPAGAKFEIVGETNGPRFATSLGSCAITKITGQIPSAPGNVGVIVPLNAPTVGTCTAGTSLSLAATGWNGIAGSGNYFNLANNSSESVVMRFSSLPGCKLAGNGIWSGLWSNQMTATTSGVHFDAERPTLKWANDGGTCALAGQSETVWWESSAGSIGNRAGFSLTVKNLTSPGTPILLTS